MIYPVDSAIHRLNFKGQCNKDVMVTEADNFVFARLGCLFVTSCFGTSTTWSSPCCFGWNNTLKVQSSSLLCYVHLVPDIDECSFENECHVNATCTNTIGSYTYTCNSGYQGDGRNCAGKSQKV